MKSAFSVQTNAHRLRVFRAEIKQVLRRGNVALTRSESSVNRTEFVFPRRDEERSRDRVQRQTVSRDGAGVLSAVYTDSMSRRAPPL